MKQNFKNWKRKGMKIQTRKLTERILSGKQKGNVIEVRACLSAVKRDVNGGNPAVSVNKHELYRAVFLGDVPKI